MKAKTTTKATSNNDWDVKKQAAQSRGIKAGKNVKANVNTAALAVCGVAGIVGNTVSGFWKGFMS